ncbi:hypothetical protein WJX73_001960 [Symbiochloris irregularis]|uniref:4-hydroxy-tetrahydrodipicolinate synthase n=1 Tax=Symbiochloris irregularis TaxID=706552 RepID=A0AAW1NNQ8_9CHLO
MFVPSASGSQRPRADTCSKPPTCFQPPGHHRYGLTRRPESRQLLNATAVQFTSRLLSRGLRQYLKFLWSQGGRNIIINGTSGEFAAMTIAERKQALEEARSVWPGDQGGVEPCVLMNNVSSTCLEEILELLQHSEEQISTPRGQQARADAVLVLPPYYLAGVPEEGNAAFLRRVLAASSLPVYVYNFPANTNCMVSPKLYAQLAQEFPNLRGVKNTFENTQLAKQFKDAAPQLQVYVGSDKLSVDTLKNGMDGVIGGGGSSAMAGPFVEIWHAHQRGDLKRARALQDIMDTWTAKREELGLLDIPAGKAAMQHHLPFLSPTCRPPLMPVPSSNIQMVHEATAMALKAAQCLR